MTRETVSTIAIVFMVFTLLFTTLMPVIAAIVFWKKEKYYLGSLFAGLGVFTVFQFILRIPLLQFVFPKMQWYQVMATNEKYIWIYAIFLGLTAGIFEETGRFLAFKTLLKNHLNWKDGVAFGIGHGGIESILLVGLSYINNLFISFVINAGLFDAMIAPALPGGQADMVKSQLIDTPSYMFFVSGLERGMTFVIHIAFSVLVMAGIQKRKGLLYLGLAIFIHMLLDSPAVIMMSKGVSIWIIETFILLFVVAAVLYLVKTGKDAKNIQKEDGETHAL